MSAPGSPVSGVIEEGPLFAFAVGRVRQVGMSGEPDDGGGTVGQFPDGNGARMSFAAASLSVAGVSDDAGLDKGRLARAARVLRSPSARPAAEKGSADKVTPSPSFGTAGSRRRARRRGPGAASGPGRRA
jgi:hypothetical protein